MTTKPQKQPTPAERLSAAQLRKTKNTVIELETENYSSLILWRSTGNWWKMCQHSALAYAYKIAPEVLGKKDSIDLRVDTDHYFYAKDGVTSVPNIEKFTELLAKYDIKLSSRSTDDIVVFNLPRKYHFTEKDLESYRIAEQGRYDKINAMFRVKNVYPSLNSEVRKLLTSAYQLVHDLHTVKYDLVGRTFYQKTLDVHEAYMDIEHSRVGAEAGLMRVQHHAEKALNVLHVISESRFAPSSRIEGPARHLYYIHSIITGELRKISQAESEKRAREQATAEEPAKQAPEEA